MLLADLVSTSDRVSETSSRLTKRDLLAECLVRLGPDEAVVGLSFLAGEPRQRKTGIGYRGLGDLPEPAAEPSLELLEVDGSLARIEELAGPGSSAERARLARELFARATAAEQRFLRGLLTGGLRQGALAGVLIEGVARAAEVDAAAVRRALLLAGDLPIVGAAALAGGREALLAFRIEVGRPLAPMLAGSAPDAATAIERLGTAGAEWKLDGIRVQIHTRDGDVRVFTRSLDDITDRMPELVDVVRALPVSSAILDGEAIVLDADERPLPFQVTASRAARRTGSVALSLRLFDCLHLDGEDLIDHPASERTAALAAHVPAALCVPRILVHDAAGAEAALAMALSAGHEGLVLKALDAPYEAGRRGGTWLKVKPRHTLDLVILAVEWGSGRRRGLLSNLHLGARDPAGGLVMLGKTFKGLTDEMLRWQTEKLLELAVERDEHVVYVRPELVVEIAFDGVQTSTRYPGGVALRFARVVRHRPDKPASEADTIDAVRAFR
ncbi:MAG TPA: ATP-dependent DNA ligase [Gaiellales bacterium]